jgi:hypothetical protein
VAEEDHSVLFKRTERGLIRFPSNIEQLSVEYETTANWLVVRRNDTVFRFPLSEEDCVHIAKLLTSKLPIRRDTNS